MVTKLQRRFVFTAMTAITLLLLFLLLVFNVAGALFTMRQNHRLLHALSDTAAPPRSPRGVEKILDPEPNDDSKLSAVYFIVGTRADGSKDVDLSRIASVSYEQALSIADRAQREEGFVQGFLYRRSPMPDGGSKLVFLDTINQRNYILRTVLLSSLAGILCWGIMLLVVVLLSKNAIAPIAENIESQRRFVTDAGHELKTPLAIILANTEAMELCSGETKYSRNIRHQVQRLDGLTKNLLTLARADEGRLTGDLESVDFSALTKQAVSMFKELAEQKGLSLQWEIKDNLFLSGNREQLSRLLSILLDNAVKYSGEKGCISLKLQGNDRLLLELRNSVDSCDVPTKYMFERFYRADESRNQKGGYGIGLSAAQAIVQNHGGTISAEYENGNTICFKVKI